MKKNLVRHIEAESGRYFSSLGVCCDGYGVVGDKLEIFADSHGVFADGRRWNVVKEG